jgi:hypothetical protein
VRADALPASDRSREIGGHFGRRRIDDNSARIHEYPGQGSDEKHRCVEINADLPGGVSGLAGHRREPRNHWDTDDLSQIPDRVHDAGDGARVSLPDVNRSCPAYGIPKSFTNEERQSAA